MIEPSPQHAAPLRTLKLRELALLREKQKRRSQNRIAQFYPETGPLRRELYPKHMRFFALGETCQVRGVVAANRVGKALRHGTLIATPRGWLAIEHIRIGDIVIAGDGSPTPVTGVYPQGEVDLYSLLLDGHTEIVACGEHQWVYQHPRARYPTRRSHRKTDPNPFFGQWSVGRTVDLVRFGANTRTRAVIPGTGRWQLEAADLPLDPYLLGLLLGDGSLSRDSIKFSSVDDDLVQALAAEFRVTKYAGCDYGICGAVPVIRQLGLLGLTSVDKFIPDQYLFASAEQRLALLQGLMDTDGSIHGPGGNMEFSTCSDRLADGFEWLAISLGIKVRRARRHTKAQNGNGLPSWRITIRTGKTCPFRLARKVTRWKPLRETSDWVLHGVTPAGRGEATCIEVAHPSHTYVIERGVVTHNTEGCGLYELTCHLTGRYPDWWVGARFDAPIRAWAAGDTGKTTRDILQLKLLGPYGSFGTGLMPADCVLKTTPKQGVSEAIELATFQHYDSSGHRDGVSRLTLKSYDQGRLAFQGTEQDVILLDEESYEGIRNECLLRLMTTDGLLIETFTPLKGLTPLVLNYMPEGHVQDESGVIVSENKAMVQIGWDDVPHLAEKQKAMMLAETPPHLIDARSKGVPSMGAGAIYPLAETEFLVDDLPIPAHWPRVYGMDVGWNRTAAVWAALDRDTKTLYLYAEYYKGQAEPPIHASAIKAKGEWIPGVIDPASRGRTQNDGKQLLKLYKDEGLDLTPADNAREVGLLDAWKLLSTGRLKVFKSLQHFRTEFRMYRRNENGDIVKENDHLMDATRYLVRSGLKRAKVQPVSKSSAEAWAPLDRGMGY